MTRSAHFGGNMLKIKSNQYLDHTKGEVNLLERQWRTIWVLLLLGILGVSLLKHHK